MKRLQALLALPAVLMFATVGCDTKSPSKGNFKSALQGWWDKNPPCASTYPALPAEFDLSNKYESAERSRMDGLKSAGLLTSVTGPKTVKDPYTSAFGLPAKTSNFVTYSVGGANSSAWHTSAGGSQELCFAKVHVKAVDNFTEPSDVFGMKATQVAYTYEFTDFPSWAKDSAVQAVYPQIKTALAKPSVEATDTLILTNNGWSKSLK